MSSPFVPPDTDLFFRSDEMNCPECGPNQFRCQDGQCIPSSLVCDKQAQCVDRSDELSCCGELEFQCALSQECIAKEKMCDGSHDCTDSSDELPLGCSNKTLLPQTGSNVVTATTSTYLIAIFAGQWVF